MAHGAVGVPVQQLVEKVFKTGLKLATGSLFNTIAMMARLKKKNKIAT